MLLKFALVLVSICAISAQVLPPLGFRRVRPGPTVLTNSGPIQGQEETYDVFRRIHTFKGIRYGLAPVGNLRFRQPIPPTPWSTTFQAWNYGPQCPQFSVLTGSLTGEEDCLFLNIAAPVNIRSRLPVVFSIHGGGLQVGNGEMSFLGPELINQENVIFVSLNYRLGVLGFLNTGDFHSPGNFGLKDMILALRWVQNNIEFFGGNKDDVTIHGVSGGGVAVHALVISPVAAGLFHKAISHSGSLFNYWAFNPDPSRSVQQLTRNLQLQVSNNEDLITQLRGVSVARLLNAATSNALPSSFDDNRFMPSIDAFNSQEPRVLPVQISFQIRNGNINQVPYLVGFNAIENLHVVRDIVNDPTILERFNQNPHLLIPTEWRLIPNSLEAQEVINAFRNIYFGGSPVITQDMALQWANYVSDRSFIFGISKQARLHRLRQPVNYFRFSYSGALNFLQRIFGLSEIPVAMHGDDYFYLFRLNIAVVPVAPSDEAFTVQRRFVRLWTNFIKFGDPTPTLIDPLINTNWTQLTESENFLEIGENLSMQTHPNGVRMTAWHTFDQRFNP